MRKSTKLHSFNAQRGVDFPSSIYLLLSQYMRISPNRAYVLHLLL